jgi:hypothetical protein
MPLPAIPAEIPFEIASHLTYHDFVAYFEFLQLHYQLKPTRIVLKDVFVRTENTDPTQFADQNSLPCYGCFRLRKEYNFYPDQRTYQRTLGCVFHLKRLYWTFDQPPSSALEGIK